MKLCHHKFRWVPHHESIESMQTWITRVAAQGNVCDNNKYCTVFDTNIHPSLSVTPLSPHAFLKISNLIFIVIETNSVILHKPIIHNSWGGAV